MAEMGMENGRKEMAYVVIKGKMEGRLGRMGMGLIRACGVGLVKR